MLARTAQLRTQTGSLPVAAMALSMLSMSQRILSNIAVGMPVIADIVSVAFCHPLSLACNLFSAMSDRLCLLYLQ
jgi:hypothetical protein